MIVYQTIAILFYSRMNINILWITYNYLDYVDLCKIIQHMLLIFMDFFFIKFSSFLIIIQDIK